MAQNFLDTTTHTISWISKRDQDDELDLSPAFQRKPVWTDKQKSYLVDTILRGYPVPELYIQEFTDASGQDKYIVVDGQQRIRACLDFLKGRFSLDEEDSPEWGGLFFEDLVDALKKAFYGYNFVVRKLPDMPGPEIRGMFIRLNRNVVALNQQELRHATYWGDFIKTCEKISDHEAWPTFGLFTPNDFRRMLDVEFISELVIGYLHGPQKKKTTLDRYYAAYEEEFERQTETERAFNRTLGELSSTFPDIQKTRWKKKSDFYSLFVVFLARSRDFPLTREARDRVYSELVSFGEQVDNYLASNEEEVKWPQNVRDYGNAVERAASDLQNRKTRDRVLRDLLVPQFQEVVA